MANRSQPYKYEKIREVYTFMNNASKQRKDVIQYFAKKWTDEGFFGEGTKGISKHRTIDNYIRRVKDTYMNFEKEVDDEKGRTLARLDDLYARLIKVQDYKGALSVLREISDIVGYKPPLKTDLTTGGEKLQIVLSKDDQKL